MIMLGKALMILGCKRVVCGGFNQQFSAYLGQARIGNLARG